MRAPTYISPVNPVEAFKARFWGPGASPLGSTIGHALAVGAADLNEFSAAHSAIHAVIDNTAGRARALQDKAALTTLVDAHADMNGGDAVTAQPQALNELAKIQADGQATLFTPGMIAAYDQQMGPAMNEATNQITGHALRQAVVERQAVADQELRSAQQAAANAWQDPVRLVQGLDAVKTVAAGQTSDAASAEDQASAVRSAVGGAVVNAVGQAFAAGEPEFAAHIMSGWGDTLSPAAYQLAVAKLGQAAQTQRNAAIFGEAAGGNPPTGASDVPVVPSSPNQMAIGAPVGAAVHPVAGGTVSSIGGAPDNATVRILHPDGSSTGYGGVGLAAVVPGDLVTPAHVIGSASPVVTLTANSPTGDAIDAGMLLRKAGGESAVVGGTDTPRIWNTRVLLDRIAERNDLSAEDQALAISFAQRRMAADHMLQTANDVGAGRSVVSLLAADPERLSHAADLLPDVAGQMSPSALAQVDGALRNMARATTTPDRDNPKTLRLELEQRLTPDVFAGRNLAQSIGEIHPADLAQLASSQAASAAGLPDSGPQDGRAAILDAIARHETVNTATLPDDVLPQVHNTAATMLRLNQIDPSDRASIDNTVADAIQSHVVQP